MNTADLMTKHLAITMILRHMSKLNLVHVGGRSDAAVKLHSVEESLIPSRTSGRIIPRSDVAPRKSFGDYWAEKGEHGRWVRIHVEPRTDRFDPWVAPKGPGRKTRLRAMRRIQGTFESGENFNDEDEWQLEKGEKGRLDIFNELRTR